MKSFRLILTISVMSLLLVFACKKEEPTPNAPGPTPTGGSGIPGGISSGTSMLTSIGGVVLDESEAPIENAMVTIDSYSMLTDANGVFVFRDISVGSKRTYIEIEKAGYFHGSRAVKPQASGLSEVKIILLDQTVVGSVGNAAGGAVNVPGGAQVVFTANDVTNPDGSAYTGNVNVAAHYLDPNLNETYDQMPGDLMALNSSVEEVILSTFGMIAVELTDDAGQELIVAAGETVELRIPLSGDYLANAPATIDLWYFDDVEGAWKQEGSATLVGNEYVGEVGHFTFWNCDVPSSVVDLSGSVFASSIPVQGVRVRVRGATGGGGGSVYTNAAGEFSGGIAMGLDLILELFDECGTLIYTNTYGPYSANTTLPNIDIGAAIASTSGALQATLTDCSGDPTANGVLHVDIGGTTKVLFADASGVISTTLMYCSAATVSATGYDFVTGLASDPSTMPVGSSMNFGAFTMCDTVLADYITYTADTIPISVTNLLGDSVGYYVDSAGQESIVAMNLAGTELLQLAFLTPPTGVGTFATDSSLTYYFGSASFGSGTVDVTFTTFGSTQGSYYEGTFSGTVFDIFAGVPVALSGNFRCRKKLL